MPLHPDPRNSMWPINTHLKKLCRKKTKSTLDPVFDEWSWNQPQRNVFAKQSIRSEVLWWMCKQTHTRWTHTWSASPNTDLAQLGVFSAERVVGNWRRECLLFNAEIARHGIACHSFIVGVSFLFSLVFIAQSRSQWPMGRPPGSLSTGCGASCCVVGVQLWSVWNGSLHAHYVDGNPFRIRFSTRSV